MTKADVFPRGSAVKEYGTPKSGDSTTLTAFGSPIESFGPEARLTCALSGAPRGAARALHGT